MTMTPAIKGLLTKAAKSSTSAQEKFNAVRIVFAKRLPAEQAKHATRNYLATV
jgi:hypothetical protein